jgi:hypothetical protein
MRTRLEIFRNGSWIPLLLPTNQKIKYNAVINKIGKVSSRELSHTNTFSIPKVWQNIQALGLNKFNPRTLTTPLNSKYEANYYVEDKLLQSGFIVVNNVPSNQIKLNFISGGLRLVDLWSSTTFLKLLTDPNIERPTDYQTNIDEISSYDMTLEPMVKTNDVGSRGYKLCSFPNNLNQLGDDFQKNTNDVRVADSFIPRQSRPTFGAMALFDLAIESFGYTSIYDESVDWGVVEKTYMTSKQASEGKEAKDASAEIVYATIPAGDNHHVNCRTIEQDGIWFRFQYFKRTAMRFQGSTATRPIQVPGFNPQHPRFGGPQNGLFVEFQRNDPNKYLNYNTIFQPFVVNGNTGTIRISASLDAAGGVNLYEYTDGNRAQVIAIWHNQNPASGTIETILPQTIIEQNGQGFDIEIDKSFIDSPPADSNGFAGIMVLLSSGYEGFPSISTFSNFEERYARIDNMATSETYLLAGEVAFNDDGSFGSSTVDLTYAAHQDTVKDLLMGVMNKEGILMSINDTDKTVKLFSYGHYEAQKESGNFYDWTEYLQKYDVITRDTNYGKEFGRVNQISLTKPYSGNVYNFNLSNHEDGSSKYKDFAKNEIKQFNDVSKVIDIANPTTPYFEYELIEKGLVEQVSDLGNLNQINFANSSQGTISGLTAFANVNYLTIPRGISEWYNLIDRALRIEAKFLLPISLIKTLDISKPVYISDLGGYYIIEEVSEYVDAITPVKIKLIKLVDNLRQYYTTKNIVFYDRFLQQNKNEVDGSFANQSTITYEGREEGETGIFNGTDNFVSYTNEDYFSFTDGTSDKPFSMGGFLQAQDISRVGIVLAKRDLSINDEYQVAMVSSKLDIILFDEPNAGSVRIKSNTLIDDTPYSWCVTYDGSGSVDGLNIYINGQLNVSERSSTGTYINMDKTNSSFKIGTRGNTYFEGNLDSVFISDRVLELSEIEEISSNVLSNENIID